MAVASIGIPAGAARVIEHNALVFKRMWRGSMTVSFFTPLFFIASMGLGLGSLVNKSSGGVGGVPYIDFLAPGLLAATTMQTAAFECTYPVLGKILWDHIYDAMLATPLVVRDIVIGEVAWVTIRMLMVATIFWVVMAAFGVAHTFESLLAIPAATLSGLAFATPLIAFTSTQKNDSVMGTVFRLVITPLFLFGGAFFPISRLPLVLQWVAWATPLSHGVALTRGLVLGTLVGPDAALHVAVLLVYAGAGAIIALPLLTRRLVK
ncbi:MAG TPA: ABC transporter permease [Candidatus Dormibacteraeota bacterium]|nr:ABC transporter permease [Candidatus Dormibacteraeota bacterium]